MSRRCRRLHHSGAAVKRLIPSSIATAAMAAATALAFAPASATAQMITKTEHFNSDPGWDGRNNHASIPSPQPVTQDFGYKSTSNAGGASGEVGGFITPVGEAAYYGKVLAPLSFNSPLTVTGSLKLDGGGNVELGFFNNSTVNEWRTPNTVAFRLYGRGSHFLAYPEYGTSKWRAGAGGGDFEFNTAAVHPFSLTYDPNGNSGGGTITGTISGVQRVVNLSPGHKSDGAIFNRFGFLNISKSWDGAGSFWIDNVNINGVAHNFSSNPGWEGLNNNTTYTTTNVRPRFDFGYSATSHSGGAGSGEMGGQIFRGDSHSDFNGSRMAYYGDVLPQTLNLNQPLVASGKVSFNRGVSDSTTLIGFFHDDHSNVNDNLGRGRDFLGAVIEGPSSEGHFFYPGYLTDQLGVGAATRGNNLPYIYPNGDSHDWSLNYDPTANGGNGRIYLSLDGQQGYVDLQPGHKSIGAHFNRFGIITTHIDGNGQTVWLDDLTYTIGFGNDSQWAGDTSGDWHTAANWSGLAGVPNAVGAKAVFGSNNTAGRTVYINNPATVGTIEFGSANSWLLTGLASLTLQASSGSAQVNVTQGTHKINLPVTIASNTVVTVAGGAQLIVSDPVTVNAGKSLSHAGAGTVTYQSTFKLGSGSSVAFVVASAELAGLKMASDATADVSGGSLLVMKGDFADLRSKVKQGFNGGAWDGGGGSINSSAAAGDASRATALGIGRKADAVLVRYTFYGDADLDGSVDLDDFGEFALGYEQAAAASSATWTSGDFDYSGATDANDFDLFLRGLVNQGRAIYTPQLYDALSAFVTANGIDADLSAVPEPSAFALFAVAAAAAGLPARRHRRGRRR